MNPFDLFIQRLEETRLDEIERAEIIGNIGSNVEHIFTVAEKLIDNSLENIRLVYDIFNTAGMMTSTFRNYDAGKTADKIADYQMVITAMAQMMGIDHINLAVRLEQADPETIDYTFQELRTLSPAKIHSLRETVDKWDDEERNHPR